MVNRPATSRSRACLARARGPMPNSGSLRPASKRFEEGQAASRQSLAGQVEAMQLKLARSIEELAGSRARYRRQAEQDVVGLALAVARRILHRELTVSPEALLGLVKAALDKMESRELHQVRVSRQDAAMVKQFFEQMGLPYRVEVLADSNLPPGGVILESGRGSLDASVDTQLAEIERGFVDLVRQLMNLKLYCEKLARIETCRWTGSVSELVGLLVESKGPEAAVGDFCEISTRTGRLIRTQVIGFRDGHVLSMPLEETDGLHLGDPIVGAQGRRPDGGGSPTARPRDRRFRQATR